MKAQNMYNIFKIVPPILKIITKIAVAYSGKHTKMISFLLQHND